MESLPIVMIMGWLMAASGGISVPGSGAPPKTDQAAARSSMNTLAGTLRPKAVPDPPRARDPWHAPEACRKSPGFFSSRARMARRAEADQPDWLSPIATTSGRIKDEFRFDVLRPIVSSGQTDYALGGGKGLEFLVAPRVQLMVGIPSFAENPHDRPRDGFGDLPVMVKYRVAAAPHGEGDYLLTLLLKATLPTGSNLAGLHSAVLTPGIAFGKGWKWFDVQSALGSTFPTGGTARLGRQLLWDTAFQVRARHKLWPELELNSTRFITGRYEGRSQAFLTPGVGFGRVHLCGPISFSAAAGFQVAATEFHTYNHQVILSFRFPF